MSKPVVEKSGVYQDFDLREMFGDDVEITDELKESVGQAILYMIRQRTEEGKAIGGTKSFAEYSPDYVESLPFKAFGKTEDNVNLTQSGDLLVLMDIVSRSGDKIRIGWEDELQNLKAYNHNHGDTVKKREFFGLSASETKEIAKEFKPAARRVSRDADPQTDRALDFLRAMEADDGEE